MPFHPATSCLLFPYASQCTLFNSWQFGSAKGFLDGLCQHRQTDISLKWLSLTKLWNDTSMIWGQTCFPLWQVVILTAIVLVMLWDYQYTVVGLPTWFLIWYSLSNSSQQLKGCVARPPGYNAVFSIWNSVGLTKQVQISRHSGFMRLGLWDKAEQRPSRNLSELHL